MLHIKNVIYTSGNEYSCLEVWSEGEVFDKNQYVIFRIPIPNRDQSPDEPVLVAIPNAVFVPMRRFDKLSSCYLPLMCQISFNLPCTAMFINMQVFRKPHLFYCCHYFMIMTVCCDWLTIQFLAIVPPLTFRLPCMKTSFVRKLYSKEYNREQ